MLFSVERKSRMREQISLTEREDPRTQTRTKALISRLLALAKTTEDTQANETQHWEMLFLQRTNQGACVSVCVDTQRLNVQPWNIHLLGRLALGWRSVRDWAMMAWPNGLEESKPAIMGGRHRISVWVFRSVVLFCSGACSCQSVSRTFFSSAPWGVEWGLGTGLITLPGWRSNWKKCPRFSHLGWV